MGCYSPRYVYSPSAHNVPRLAKQGDKYGALLYSGNLPGDKSNSSGIFKQQTGGLDMQGAMAVSKRWAVQSAFIYRKETNHGNTVLNNGDSTIVRYKRMVFEAGAGYFNRIANNANYFFQVFGGIGLGSFKFTDIGRMSGDPNYSRYHHAGVFKCYIQPAIYVSASKFPVSTSLSSRFTLLKLHDVKTNYTSDEQSGFLLEYVDKQPYMFWEPAVAITVGSKKLPVSLSGQMGYSFLISEKFIDYRSLNLSIGASLTLSKKLKTKAL